MTGPTPEDLRLALRAATLYYLDGLTQAEIASRLGVSRPTAGRLVAKAKANGLVRIEVVVPPDISDDLHADEERELERRFGLTEAVVASNASRAGAALLMRRIGADEVLGFTWGPEQVGVASALVPGIASCRAVVQLDGAMSTAAYQTGTEQILTRCADTLRAETFRLPAPLYADPATVVSMREDSVISRTLDAGRRAEVMLFGVGAVSTSTTLFEGSFLDIRMLDELVSLGAVGEIGGRFFNAYGEPVHDELQQRAMSVPLEDIRTCEKTILVSGGASKHQAILGALRGKLARLLVCDIDCARWLLTQ
ncbi:MarR family transcriptional regulator [Mycolicibacterium wolinskyi]|uniref:MarR family transcriptional regulator n=1 Tax=Mycolicibacterium wolinskyi TaxID=59750 RepID=A0A1X2FE41_9MYCO|nr:MULTISPECIES: sugar-binding domain-containing protein [Mycolicibacterium]MCV7284581.1 MarR family transcriptional regulator [Mycolicibacterium wolinskyi]MCV7291966.1 MarR family transcriptional regulator [Mycolicibacterium goodii]ORX16657.1 MarR family transcriptional regulator [Mycolicibacterium wolinskyi]